MTDFKLFLWGTAILLVGVLNILDVLPDWTTIAAVLTLPFVAAVTRTCCTFARSVK